MKKKMIIVPILIILLTQSIYAEENVMNKFSAMFNANEEVKKEKENDRIRKENERIRKRETLSFTNSIGMKFVPIPAGSFMMGEKPLKCPKDDPFTSTNEFKKCYDKMDKRTQPYHKVTLKSFYMGTTEVTQMQWYKIMGTNPAYFKQDKLGYDSRNNPVENINHKDIKKFIKKLNKLEKTTIYSLPSESQWEYAARAGSTTKWFFGNNLGKKDLYSWYRGRTHPVATKKANKWGLYDVYRNVGEYVEDGWFDNYNNAPIDGSARISDRMFNNKYVVRGTSYIYKPKITTSYFRTYAYSKEKYNGFRVAYNKSINSSSIKKQAKKVDTTFTNSNDIKKINKKDINVKTNTQNKDFYNSLNGSSNKPVDIE